MRLIIIGFALFMFSCSQNFSEDLIESCESVELRTCSGTVLDYYTEEPIPKARIKLIDFTPEAEGLIVGESNHIGEFEYQVNVCADFQTFKNRLEVTHESYDGSIASDFLPQEDMVIKMYRNTNLKVNIFESDKSSIANVVLKFRYDLGNGYQITAKNVTSESETQNVFTLPEGLDIEFSYIVDGIDSDIQILKLSGAEEILVSYE